MKAWRDLRELPRGVWVLFATTLVNRAGTMALPFMVLYLTRDLGFTAAQAGSVLFVYGVGAFVSAALSGRLSDVLGPMHVIRDSLFASGAILLLFPLARSNAAVIAMTLLLSFATEAFRPASMAVVADLVKPAQRKPAFALTRLAINLGMSVGPAVGGFLATVSFPSIFYVNGACSLAAGLLLLIALRRAPVHRSHAEVEGAVELPSRRAWSDSRLLFFLAALLPVSFVFFQHMSSMALFIVRDLGLTEIDYGLFFTINTLLIVVLEVPINSATAHWPHRITLAMGAFLFGVGFGALAIAWDFWSVVATVVVWTFGEMFLFPSLAAYVTDIAPKSRRGEYMGLTQMAISSAFAIGPWAGTAMLEKLGGRTLWIVCFALGLAATVMMLRVKDDAPTRAAPVVSPV